MLTVGALLAFAGLASAEELPIEEPEELEDPEEVEGPEDTVFNFGYDEESQLFVWNTSPTDGQYDCTLADGPVHSIYAIDDGSIVVDGLTRDVDREESDVTFVDREDETADPIPYAADGDCALSADEVAGPNGQINHGIFMKLFNSLYDGPGRGCLNRYLAQSDLGRGDQQVRVSDVDPDAEPVMDEDTGEIEFSTSDADCERGNANGHANGNANGHANSHGDDGPEAASSQGGGRPDSPGKSADAPGRNK